MHTLDPRLLRAFAIAGIPGFGNPGAPTDVKDPLTPVGGEARVSDPPANASFRGFTEETGLDISVQKRGKEHCNTR